MAQSHLPVLLAAHAFDAALLTVVVDVKELREEVLELDPERLDLLLDLDDLRQAVAPRLDLQVALQGHGSVPPRQQGRS